MGQAAKRIGISAKAIRLYERRGLLPEVRRSESGYRLYDETDLGILRFIRRARSLGLGLDEIRDVLALQRSGKQTCGAVVALLDAHIAEIDRALVDLYALRSTLSRARATANSDDGTESAVVCHIIEGEIPDSRLPTGNGHVVVNGHTVEGRPGAWDDPRRALERTGSRH